MLILVSDIMEVYAELLLKSFGHFLEYYFLVVAYVEGREEGDRGVPNQPTTQVIFFFLFERIFMVYILSLVQIGCFGLLFE